MSKSAFQCRVCHYVLGYRHHGGTLHGRTGVTVSIDLRHRDTPVAYFICPQCGSTRDYRDGVVLLRLEDPRKSNANETKSAETPSGR